MKSPSVRPLRRALLLPLEPFPRLFLQDRCLWHGQHFAEGQIQAFGGRAAFREVNRRGRLHRLYDSAEESSREVEEFILRGFNSDFYY